MQKHNTKKSRGQENTHKNKIIIINKHKKTHTTKKHKKQE